MRLTCLIALGLVACSPDATVSVSVGGGDARDATILVPTADVSGATHDGADASTGTSPGDTGTSAGTTPGDTSTGASPGDTGTSTSTTPEDTSTSTTPEDTSTSTSPEDTSASPEDTSTSPEDTSTTPDDTSAADDAEVVDEDPFAPGALVYTKVGNIVAVDDLRRVRWDPSGAYALVLGTGNLVLVYDPETNALASAGTLGTTVTDLEAANEGGYFMVVGVAAGQSTLWRVSLDADRKLVVDDTIAIPVGTARAVVAEPGTSPTRFAIGAAGATMYQGHLYLFDVKTGLSAGKGFSSSAGLSDLMWGDPAIQSGSANLVTSEGENGTGSHSWVLAADLVVGNGWGNGFGNSGRAAWRPDGGYGVTTGWSSNKLYVYDGAWTMATLPVPNGASPNAIAWRDYRRGLVVGRVIATPPYAVVIDLREGLAEGWTGSMVDQSIKGFDKPPWSGNSGSMHLLDVDWRPGVACDEGLIVGSDNGTQLAPSFGLAIRFHDGDDPACAD